MRVVSVGVHFTYSADMSGLPHTGMPAGCHGSARPRGQRGVKWIIGGDEPVCKGTLGRFQE